MKKFDVIKKGNDQILVISGASGVGKTTTCALLGMLYPANYVHIPFDRSRASRPGEFGSRHVDLDTMHEKYNAGEYFNIAPVTHGGFAAIRTADIKKAFSDHRIESDKFGSGRIDRYKNDDLLTLNDHNLVLITERDRLGDTVYEIDRYMRIQTLTLSKLQEVEKLGGISGVQKFLKSLRVPKHDYTQSEHYEFLENKLPKTEDFER